MALFQLKLSFFSFSLIEENIVWATVFHLIFLLINLNFAQGRCDNLWNYIRFEFNEDNNYGWYINSLDTKNVTQRNVFELKTKWSEKHPWTLIDRRSRSSLIMICIISSNLTRHNVWNTLTMTFRVQSIKTNRPRWVKISMKLRFMLFNVVWPLGWWQLSSAYEIEAFDLLKIRKQNVLNE